MDYSRVFCILIGKMSRNKVYARLIEISANDPGRAWKFSDMIEKLKTEFPKFKFDEDRYIGYWFFSHFV